MKAGSRCHVTALDYDVHWGGGKAPMPAPPPPVWDGQERRVGPADRRITPHDRRWQASAGRRFRAGDRRRRRRTR